MKHIGLFEGIGGFSLAARWMGWETIAWCEINEFCQKVLKHHFKEAIGYGDIKTTDFSIHRGTVDILTGGFPCQPYSQAGKRLGKEDERHLWPEMLRAIREIQPRWVVGENVFGLVNWNGGMVFDEVQADLEAEGFEVQPFVLPACAVNAVHRRDRVWFVAYAGLQRQEKRQKQTMGIEQLCKEWYATNPESRRLSKWDAEQLGEREKNQNDKQLCSIPEWSNFPTQSPVYSRNDGLPVGLDIATISAARWRTESIKAYGNAIVPQVALQIFKAIEKMKQSYTEGGVGENKYNVDAVQ